MELVTVKNKFQVVIPNKLRQRMKIKVGDFMEAKVEHGSVVFTPKKVVDDYSDMPNADDEYTPAQRRAIDKDLAKALADVKAGRVYGPFDTHDKMVKFLHEKAKRPYKTKKQK
jgi:bifunctional DNA-binding transcriptional regulator/antitoxin component of YhaV-PrlF toxin-antitoxin module